MSVDFGSTVKTGFPHEKVGLSSTQVTYNAPVWRDHSSFCRQRSGSGEPRQSCPSPTSQAHTLTKETLLYTVGKLHLPRLGSDVWLEMNFSTMK